MFALLGAHTVLMQRIAFYLFYAFMWTVIYIRYQSVIKKAVLFCYPLCFIFVISTYSMGTVVLSEHLAGIGFIILFLEYLSFSKRERLERGSCIMLSVAILLTFGTIFIAAFGLAAAAFGVAVQEIYWAVRDQNTLAGFVKNIWLKYWKLGAAVGLPWFIYLIYLKITGTVYLFYYSVYVMNRTIYSQYLGGFGSSIISSVFGTVANFASMIQSIIPGEGYSAMILIQTIITILAVMCLIHIFQKYGVVTGCTCAFIVLTAGLRGYYSYHGTQCIALLCMMASWSFVELLVVSKETFKSKSAVYQTCIVMTAFLVMSVYISGVGSFARLSLDEVKNEYAEKIARITEKDEAVWNCTISNEIFMQADRAGLYNIGGVPWFWEAHARRVLDSFGDEPPRVILFDRNAVIWGKPVEEYGSELIAYLNLRYKRYEESSLYIRNDYYEQAAAVLDGEIIKET